MYLIFYWYSLAAVWLHVHAQYGHRCLTSNQESGLCMPLKSCPPLYDIFESTAASGREELSEEQVNLIKRSYCGTFGQVHHVCCLESEIELNADGLRILSGTCGGSHNNKVSNGAVTTLFSFPWMALLKYDLSNTFKCGGSLISDRYVLTAAHCVKGQEAVLTSVRLGEYNISSELDCMQSSVTRVCSPPVEDVEIEEIIIPDNYKLRSIHHDIALLRLHRKVTFNRHIKPICLPLTKRLINKQNDYYIISGWGRTETDHSSEVLRAAVIKSMDRDTCQQSFSNIPNLTYGHICAGGENLTDSCRGDSGGPLGFRGTYLGHFRFIQFGIVSFGISSCGRIDKPGIYTNVSHYLQWITDHIRD